jgi:penicillin G amidase
MAQTTTKNSRKWLLSTALAVLMAVGMAAGYVFIELRAALPPFEGDITVAGLEAPVTVTLDRFGIPAITAQSRLDAIRALGYMVARDRLFQLDLLRRRSAGQLAEILGSALLDKDIDQRVIGFYHVAQASADRLPQAQKDALGPTRRGSTALSIRRHHCRLNSVSWGIGRPPGASRIASWWRWGCSRS